MTKYYPKKHIYFLIILSSPVILSLLFNLRNFTNEWSKFPQYAFNKIKGVYTQEYAKNVYDNQFILNTKYHLYLPAKIYFNKFTIILQEIFDYLDCFKPRYYFQYFDNKLLTRGQSAISIICLPIFVISLFKNRRKTNFFIILFLSGLPSYFSGQKNLYFLFPISFCYLYLIYCQLSYFPTRITRFIFPLIIFSNITLFLLPFFSYHG